jgi:hypothetical protein
MIRRPVNPDVRRRQLTGGFRGQGFRGEVFGGRAPLVTSDDSACTTND